MYDRHEVCGVAMRCKSFHHVMIFVSPAAIPALTSQRDVIFCIDSTIITSVHPIGFCR